MFVSVRRLWPALSLAASLLLQINASAPRSFPNCDIPDDIRNMAKTGNAVALSLENNAPPQFKAGGPGITFVVAGSFDNFLAFVAPKSDVKKHVGSFRVSGHVKTPDKECQGAKDTTVVGKTKMDKQSQKISWTPKGVNCEDHVLVVLLTVTRDEGGKPNQETQLAQMNLGCDKPPADGVAIQVGGGQAATMDTKRADNAKQTATVQNVGEGANGEFTLEEDGDDDEEKPAAAKSAAASSTTTSAAATTTTTAAAAANTAGAAAAAASPKGSAPAAAPPPTTTAAPPPPPPTTAAPPPPPPTTAAPPPPPTTAAPPPPPPTTAAPPPATTAAPSTTTASPTTTSSAAAQTTTAAAAQPAPAISNSGYDAGGKFDFKCPNIGNGVIITMAHIESGNKAVARCENCIDKPMQIPLGATAKGVAPYSTFEEAWLIEMVDEAKGTIRLKSADTRPGKQAVYLSVCTSSAIPNDPDGGVFTRLKTREEISGANEAKGLWQVVPSSTPCQMSFKSMAANKYLGRCCASKCQATATGDFPEVARKNAIEPQSTYQVAVWANWNSGCPGIVNGSVITMSHPDKLSVSRAESAVTNPFAIPFSASAGPTSPPNQPDYAWVVNVVDAASNQVQLLNKKTGGDTDKYLGTCPSLKPEKYDMLYAKLRSSAESQGADAKKILWTWILGKDKCTIYLRSAVNNKLLASCPPDRCNKDKNSNAPEVLMSNDPDPISLLTIAPFQAGPAGY